MEEQGPVGKSVCNPHNLHPVWVYSKLHCAVLQLRSDWESEHRGADVLDLFQGDRVFDPVLFYF